MTDLDKLVIRELFNQGLADLNTILSGIGRGFGATKERGGGK